MAVWDGIVPEAEQEIYRAAQFGKSIKMGERPALIIIDVLWSFVGRRVSTLEAIQEYPTACGRVGWEAMDRISWLMDRFRSVDLPIVHVRADGGQAVFGGTTKTSNRLRDDRAYAIPELVAPIPGEPVVIKSKASAFFRTPLDIYLRRMGVDTVLIAGSTTSGCIRASAVDAHSLGFATMVLEDGVFDRSQFSHAVSLFELQMKYAQILTVEDAWAGILQKIPQSKEDPR